MNEKDIKAIGHAKKLLWSIAKWIKLKKTNLQNGENGEALEVIFCLKLKVKKLFLNRNVILLRTHMAS